MSILTKTSKHPYYDAKTKKDTPTWFMVDVKFQRRLDHPPTLNVLKAIASGATIVPYLDQKGLQAIKEMQLINRGRLSK